MTDVPEEENTTALDAMAREVPDNLLGPEATEAEKKAKRVELVQKSIRALNDIHEKLGMIDRALGSCLVEALQGEAIGDAVDMVSDLNRILKEIDGDGGSVAGVAKRLRFVKEVTMPELLDAAKVKTFNTERYRVTKTVRINASILAEAGYHTEGPYAGQPIAWDWLRDNGYDSLIKPTVNASSLSAVAKELIEDGRELPDDLFKVHPQTSISITKKA